VRGRVDQGWVVSGPCDRCGPSGSGITRDICRSRRPQLVGIAPVSHGAPNEHQRGARLAVGLRPWWAPQPRRSTSRMLRASRGASDDFQADYSQLEEKGPGHGFVVVTPNAGDQAAWNRTDDSNSTSFEATEANMAFVGAIIDAVTARLCIDQRRVYATGWSNGAGMAAYLGCTLKPRLAAIAPVAGISIVDPCPQGTPLSVIAFHGTADTNIPYGGGRVSRPSAPDTVLPSVEAAVGTWAKRDGCRTKPSHQPIGNEVQRIAYRGCHGRSSVALYAVTGGGHTWPGSSIDLPMNGHVTGTSTPPT
jgi:polyhydroxybutyrate depolymerase